MPAALLFLLEGEEGNGGDGEEGNALRCGTSSVCLRQPPSPAGEGKLKRHCSAYNWLLCLTQSLKRALLISGNPWGRSCREATEGLF